MIEIPVGGFAYFASDLHLSKKTPKTLAAFERWLIEVAAPKNLIFLLGDIFEVWYGDDYADEMTQRVAQAIQKASAAGSKVYFIRGNRDFLIQEDYASECHFEILEEPEFLTVNGQIVLITHGDQLCTDDKTYQKFRRESRTESWQEEFLAIELNKRIEMANHMRTESKTHKSNSTSSIMDVNLPAVEKVFKGHWPDGHYVGRSNSIIHGHTHRCAIHKVLDEKAPEHAMSQTGQLTNGLRVVLPDWHFDKTEAYKHPSNVKGGYLKLDSQGQYELNLLD